MQYLYDLRDLAFSGEIILKAFINNSVYGENDNLFVSIAKWK